ncbi:MAG: hypothetical protein J3K34DRAFT_520556 [Monoraphidium minutum]|nr:MAG: hypothetical protein J3K34DRAFT_520556 [Monoraphidium minutum]
MGGGPERGATLSRLRVLRALAHAIFPAQLPPPGSTPAEERFYNTAGGDLPAVPAQALTVIDERLMGANRAALLIVLQLLDWRLPTLLLAGRASLAPGFPWLPRALPEMPVAARQAALLGWRHSRLGGLRAAFKAVKSILLAVIIAAVDGAPSSADESSNPYYEAVSYPAGAAPRPEGAPSPAALAAEEVLASAVADGAAAAAAGGAAALRALLERRGFRVGGGGEGGAGWWVEADAVVVGSGAGGGVAAAALAGAGLRVVVLEKGSWKRMADLTWLEGESTETMFERGAFMATEDGGMSVLAGATLGGGTKVNWCASLRTPDHVRREWAEGHGLPRFATPEFDAALDAVTARLGVTTTTRLNGANGALYDGLSELGADARKLPRNCSSDECSGWCSLGCRTGHKASSDVSYLADAARRGARVITGCHARRVLLRPNSGGGGAARARRAAGVEAVVGGEEGGGGVAFEVRAPIVVASGGTLHTPALLLRSGVTCRGNVGRHLRLHPAFGVIGVFDRENVQHSAKRGAVDMYQGVMMLTYSLSAAKWEQGGYGAMVSVPSLHPGLLAACYPWDPATIKRELITMQDTAASVVFARDQGSGRVTIDGRGRPRLHYWPDAATRKSILEGMELALRAYMAAGAKKVVLPHAHGHLVATREQGQRGLDEMIRAAHAGGIHRFDMPLFSAHQMGSCRMGGSSRDSVCDGAGEVWDVAGLYVADASAFPTASGVNPMITAMAIAHMTASGIAKREVARRKAALSAQQ